jgi:putative ABC transport system permease protein
MTALDITAHKPARSDHSRHGSPPSGGLAASFVRLYICGQSCLRGILILSSLGLGAGALLAVILFLHAVGQPFRSVASLAAESQPSALAIRPVAGTWFSEDVIHKLQKLPSGMVAVPVVTGFISVQHGSNRSGGLIVGSDCRARRLGVPLDCDALRERSENVPQSQTPIAISRRLAEDIGAGAGDEVAVGGGSIGRVVAIVDHAELAHLNNGLVAFAMAHDAAALLGHPGSLTSIVLAGDATAAQEDLAPKLPPGLSIGPIAAIEPPPTLVRAQQLYGLAGLVAALTVLFLAVSGFLVGALQRRRTLATADVLGASRLRLVLGCILEGALFGLCAAPIAVVCGLAGGHVLVGQLGDRLLSGTGIVPTVEITMWFPLVATAVPIGLGCVAAALTLRATLAADPLRHLRDVRRPQADRPIRMRLLPLPVASTACALSIAWLTGQGDLPQTASLIAVALFWMGLVGIVIFAWPVLVRAVPPFPGRKSLATRLIVCADLDHSPLRTALTVSSVALSVTLLVAVEGFAVSNSTAIQRRLPSIFGEAIAIYPKAVGNLVDAGLSERALETLRADADLRERSNGVHVWSSTVLDGKFGVTGFDRGNPGTARGIATPGITAQEREQMLRRGEIILTRIAARELNARQGDTVELPTLEGPRTFRVGAVGDLVAGESSGLGATIVVDYDLSRRYWDATPAGVVVSPRPGVTLEQLKTAVPRLRGTTLVTPAEGAALAAETLTRFVAPIQAVAWLMLGVTGLVAGLGVLNMLGLGLVSRRQQRAAMRSIGMSAGHESSIVLGNALVLAGWGAVAGVAAGLLLQVCLVMLSPVLTAIPAQFVMDWEVVGVAVAAAFGIVLASALPPLIQARRLDVTRALATD